MHTLRSKLPGMDEAQRKEVKTIIRKVKNQILTNEGKMTNDNLLEVDLSVTKVTTNDIAENETVEEALNELRLMLDLGEPDEDGAFDIEHVLVSDADAEEAPPEDEELDLEIEDEDAPLEGEEAPLEGEEAPFEDEAAPLEGEEAPPEDEEPLAELSEDNGEEFEIDESTLISALREMRQSKTSRTRSTRTNKTNESAQIATLSGQVAEYAKVVESLREQLTEMNLFNAKLLYVNKLVQDKNVTSEQRRGIVESLDGAKTLREVKLLFKGLTKTLKIANTSEKKGKISESAARRSIGSSSRPVGTKSTQKTLNESSDNTSNRWATLAGLK
jgi:hypothetical protein